MLGIGFWFPAAGNLLLASVAGDWIIAAELWILGFESWIITWELEVE